MGRAVDLMCCVFFSILQSMTSGDVRMFLLQLGRVWSSMVQGSDTRVKWQTCNIINYEMIRRLARHDAVKELPHLFV